MTGSHPASHVTGTSPTAALSTPHSVLYGQRRRVDLLLEPGWGPQLRPDTSHSSHTAAEPGSPRHPNSPRVPIHAEPRTPSHVRPAMTNCSNTHSYPQAHTFHTESLSQHDTSLFGFLDVTVIPGRKPHHYFRPVKIVASDHRSYPPGLLTI